MIQSSVSVMVWRLSNGEWQGGDDGSCEMDQQKEEPKKKRKKAQRNIKLVMDVFVVGVELL